MTMLEAALETAAHGWSVFPCCPSGQKAKAPLTEHGHLDATTDPETIRKWWTTWPGAMIGAPVPETLMVLDTDPRNGGSVEALVALVGELPQTLTVWSGRGDGGRHLYFLRPYGELTQTKLPKGIDLKVRGYCILPPSIHPAIGDPYRWEIHPVAPLTPQLRELLRPSPPPRRTASSGGSTNGAPLVRLVLSLKDGERNRGLFWAACRAAEDGILQDVHDDLVHAALSPGLTESDVLRTIASAQKTVRPRR